MCYLPPYLGILLDKCLWGFSLSRLKLPPHPCICDKILNTKFSKLVTLIWQTLHCPEDSSIGWAVVEIVSTGNCLRIL